MLGNSANWSPGSANQSSKLQMVNMNNLSVVSMGVPNQLQQPALFAVPVNRTVNQTSHPQTVLTQQNQPRHMSQSGLSADLSSIEPTLPIDQSNLLFKQHQQLANQVDKKAKK